MAASGGSGKRSDKKLKIDDVRHQGSTRPNIPSNETSPYMTDEARQVATRLYERFENRDRALDPQLVWDGKGSADQPILDLEVEAPPVYIQESIHPRALIENFRREARGEASITHELFEEAFEELSFKDQVEFYRHDKSWTNRFILGDSLQVMSSLSEREQMSGEVQCIYMDPPYGVKFGSNWQPSTRSMNVSPGKAEDVTHQPEQIKAFRDTWEKGIHSYLPYLRDRLTAARDLLHETGSIFVQIGDENVHLVRALMDEVFGAENFVSQISFKKAVGSSSDTMPQVTDFILWYAKDISLVKTRKLYQAKNMDSSSTYDRYLDSNLREHSMNAAQKRGEQALPEGSRVYKKSSMIAGTRSENLEYEVEFQGNNYSPNAGRSWLTSQEGMRRLSSSGRLSKGDKTLVYVRYADDFPVTALNNFWSDTTSGAMGSKVYVVQTGSKVIQRCLLMATDPGDLVLDPTSGSGTTAYVAEQWGRKWIGIDTSKVAMALARTRLMGARFPYYLLKDSQEGRKKEGALGNSSIGDDVTPISDTPDVSRGFVYRRVPHVKLQDIANNPEIDEIHERWQGELDRVREALNKALGASFEEWEIPEEPEGSWGDEERKLLARWREIRKARLKDMDESIARGSEQEVLYDNPYEDKKRIRVCGPFTVESLSPHRPLDLNSGASDTPEEGPSQEKQLFVDKVIDNLRRGGGTGMDKSERFTFDRLESFANPHGGYIHAEGEMRSGEGEDEAVESVALAVGPERDTVSPDFIREASKYMVRLGHDRLLVCGFSFDAQIHEEIRYGRVKVLPVLINGELTMRDDPLKATGGGQLFTIFGEPDIEVVCVEDGVDSGAREFQVELKGMMVYDSVSGIVRPSEPLDIACWFIDTDYDSEFFVVRHAYFTGGGDPYGSLRKALNAEIDPDAWSALYSTVSRPFSEPSRGKIAVKAINHRGEETMVVRDI